MMLRNLFKQIDDTSSSQSREVRTQFVPRGMRLACVINCKPLNNHRVVKTLKHLKYLIILSLKFSVLYTVVLSVKLNLQSTFWCQKVAKNVSTYSISRSLPPVRKLPVGNITHPLLACHVWLSRIYKVLRNSYLQADTQTFSHFFL